MRAGRTRHNLVRMVVPTATSRLLRRLTRLSFTADARTARRSRGGVPGAAVLIPLVRHRRPTDPPSKRGGASVYPHVVQLDTLRRQLEHERPPTLEHLVAMHLSGSSAEWRSRSRREKDVVTPIGRASERRVVELARCGRAGRPTSPLDESDEVPTPLDAA